MPLRVLHTSDLHLDSLGDMGCYSLEAVANLIDKTNVDLLIIVGDLFDYYTVDESVIRFAQEEMGGSGWDYIALGHSITFECVYNEPVKAYYCGSPSTSGTVAIVDFAEDTGVQVICHSL